MGCPIGSPPFTSNWPPDRAVSTDSTAGSTYPEMSSDERGARKLAGRQLDLHAASLQDLLDATLEDYFSDTTHEKRCATTVEARRNNGS